MKKKLIRKKKKKSKKKYKKKKEKGKKEEKNIRNMKKMGVKRYLALSNSNLATLLRKLEPKETCYY